MLDTAFSWQVLLGATMTTKVEEDLSLNGGNAATRSVRKTNPIALVLGKDYPGFLFILPAVLMLTLVLLVPIVQAIYLSFQDATMGASRFVGLANFANLLTQPTFWGAFGNTVVFTTVSVVAEAVLGLATALLVNEPIRGRSLIRVALLVPWVVAPVIVGVTWKWILEPLYGILNYYLQQLHIIDEAVTWLANVNLAMPAVLVANIWHGFPFMMVMLLAGLQSIPEEEYEAATIDGASAWQRFLNVTIPHLRYIAMIGITLTTIWEFRAFDIVQVMTMGGPAGGTELLSTLIYREMFANLRYGAAAAVGTAMFVITTLLSLIYIGMIKDEVD